MTFEMIVLFDLEGTLVETCFERSPDELGSLRQTARVAIQELGIPKEVLSRERTSSGMRNHALAFARDNLPEAYGDEVGRGIQQFMDIWESKMAEGYLLYPETTEVLDDLASMGSRMGLVTSTTIKNVDAAFDRFDMGRFFDAVVTREDVELLKPDPAGILEALRRLGPGSDGKNFFFVGDSPHDVNAARNASGISIGVDRGYSKLSGVSPDFVVRDLRGVVPIVRRDVG
jgi:HAD superfamily hydrolase (TIGR01549 family)